MQPDSPSPDTPARTAGFSPFDTAARLLERRRELVARRVRFDAALASLQGAPGLAPLRGAIADYVNGLEGVLAIEAGLGCRAVAEAEEG